LQENNGGSAASVTDGVVGGGEARGRGGELKMEARVIVSSFLIYFLLSFIKTITIVLITVVIKLITIEFTNLSLTFLILFQVLYLSL
jgi:hypothetical protein